MDENPIYGPFFGVMGSASAMVFSALGAAYGTAKSGTGIAAMSVMRPEFIMKSIIPVVMAGIIGKMPFFFYLQKTQLQHSWVSFSDYKLSLTPTYDFFFF